MAVDKAYTLTMGGKTWALDCPKVEHIGDAIIQPNVYNKWGVVDGTLTITKGEEKPNVVNNYIIRLTAGEGCAIAFVGWEMQWAQEIAPVLENGKTYEISIIDNLALYIAS